MLLTTWQPLVLQAQTYVLLNRQNDYTTYSKSPARGFLFGLNSCMEIHSEKDFPELRRQFQRWRKRFPMFTHDVLKIERIIEQHITNYSNHLVNYRRTHSKQHLEYAQVEIDEINRVLQLVGKIELMAMLSQR